MIKKKLYILPTIAILIIIIFSYYFSYSNRCSDIAVIPITDHIATSPSYDDNGVQRADETTSLEIVKEIRNAEANNKVKAIVFIIDSHGGDGAGSQEVTYALRGVNKPTVSLIRGTGDSASYWIASATNHIFALPISDVGGIGITESYTDNSSQNETNGITFHHLSIGKYKDMFNSNKPLTQDEQNYIMKELQIKNQYLLQGIATDRHLSLARVKALSTGASMSGVEALRNGLIDELGSFKEVENYLSKTLGKDTNICTNSLTE